MKAKEPKKIFLSRALKPDSPFHQLKTLGHELTATSMIKISYLTFAVPSDFDAVFFYSQKAIVHFMSSCPYSESLQYGVMGKASAVAFEIATGKIPEIIGNGNRSELATIINAEWQGKKVLFPQAKKSMRSLSSLLTEVQIENLIVYNNEIDSSLALGDYDILAFTSPLNVEAYLEQHSIEEAKVVAIGSTTAGAVKRMAGVEAKYCEEPSEEGLYELVNASL